MTKRIWLGALQSLLPGAGVNGRTCASCHDGRAGWTITPTFAQQLFNNSDGRAALFRIHDAGSRPDADISMREARREGLSHQIGVTASFTRMRWTLTHGIPNYRVRDW